MNVNDLITETDIWKLVLFSFSLYHMSPLSQPAYIAETAYAYEVSFKTVHIAHLLYPGFKVEVRTSDVLEHRRGIELAHVMHRQSAEISEICKLV